MAGWPQASIYHICQTVDKCANYGHLKRITHSGMCKLVKTIILEDLKSRRISLVVSLNSPSELIKFCELFKEFHALGLGF